MLQEGVEPRIQKLKKFNFASIMIRTQVLLELPVPNVPKRQPVECSITVKQEDN